MGAILGQDTLIGNGKGIKICILRLKQNMLEK